MAHGRFYKITDEVLARAHELYPCTTWEWDAEMVEDCKRPIMTLIALKLIRHDDPAVHMGRPHGVPSRPSAAGESLAALAGRRSSANSAMTLERALR
jgi:hypothetical protein